MFDFDIDYSHFTHVIEYNASMLLIGKEYYISLKRDSYVIYDIKGNMKVEVFTIDLVSKIKDRYLKLQEGSRS